MVTNHCLKGITSYQSANLSDEEILRNFIVRKKEFHRIMSEIEKDDMSGSIQHYLLIGRRGSGKSTLLRRIMAEVNRNDKINKWLIVIYLSEEQAGVYRLYDLWDMIIRELNDRNITTDVPVWTDEIENRESYTIDLYKAINRSLNDQNKKLLLLLDNIDRIFDNIGDDSNILRELLINYKDLRIVGCSTRMNEHYWKYDLPFYQFFRTTYLDSLSSKEVKELLLHWSDCFQMPEIKHFVHHNPGKIETIRLLTDGMPRTLLNFLELLIVRPHEKEFEYLRMILDRASPLYQERLNSLAPAQRKVVLELSGFWDATGVKSLVNKCKMPGKTISALLNQLHKDRIVEKVPVGKRDNLYRISERFFNLWLLMTQGGPKEKRKVRYLTVFLENWYNKEVLSAVYSDFTHVVKTGNARHDYLALMASALAPSKYLTVEQRDSIAEEVKSYQKDVKEYQQWIPAHSKDLYDSAMNEINKANYSRAIELISEIEQESDKKYLIEAMTCILENRNPEAEQLLFKSIDLGNNAALWLLGILYSETGRNEEAEKYYLQALKKGINRALNNLAMLYYNTGRLKDAENRFKEAIDHNQHRAFHYLAWFYYLTNNRNTDVVQLMQNFHKALPDEKTPVEDAILYLYAGQMDDFNSAAIVTIPELIKADHVGDLTKLFTAFLIHKQYHFAWDWFNNPETGQQLKEMIKPFYYATAQFLKGKDIQIELLKPGSELTEAIEQITTQVNEKQKFYYD
ncbi:MAG: AAA family ATPase [Bacteroidales bacterium]|nr:AAA family ATPase [Bacteroidales bacterium]